MKLPLRLALFGAFALIGAIVGWSLGSPPPDSAERRGSIEARTATRRDQLRRRYETFNRLSESDQAAIRRLHEAVEEDPSLAKTLEEYESFVARLDPWDQQELRQITDPAERLDRVKAIAYERDRRDEPWRPSWISGRFVEGTIFRSQEFEEALALVAQSLELTKSQRESLEAIDEPHLRHLRLIQLAAPKFRERPARWPDTETTITILKLLPDGNSRRWMLDGERTDEFRRSVVPGYLTRSLLAEWQMIVPTVVQRAQLQKALDKLSERDQAEWARHHSSRLQREIIKELEKHEGPVGDFARDFEQVVALHFEFDSFARRRFGRSPGGDPDRRGTDGRREPGDEDHDSNRRPDPRRPDPRQGERDRRGD